MEKECGFNKHTEYSKILKSQQIKMSVIYMYFLNITCPFAYYHNDFRHTHVRLHVADIHIDIA